MDIFMNDGSSKATTLTKSGRFEHVSRNTRVLFHFFRGFSYVAPWFDVSFFFFFERVEAGNAVP